MDERPHDPSHRFPASRAAALWLALACALAFSFLAAAAESPIDPDRAAKVKAAAFKEIIRYTEWPSSAFPEASSPIEVLMVGRDDLLEGYLREVLRETTIHGRRIVFQQWDNPMVAQDGDARPLIRFRERLRASHAVFIAGSERARLRRILAARDGADVLTVSDAQDFVESGGMIGLIFQEGRLAIEANTAEIKKTALVMSSYVLRLARIVPEGDRP
jgi:hypothetical protein